MSASSTPSASVAYRCRRCRMTRKGRPGLVACPECGDTLVALTYGRRKRARRAR